MLAKLEKTLTLITVWLLGVNYIVRELIQYGIKVPDWLNAVLGFPLQQINYFIFRRFGVSGLEAIGVAVYIVFLELAVLIVVPVLLGLILHRKFYWRYLVVVISLVVFILVVLPLIKNTVINSKRAEMEAVFNFKVESCIAKPDRFNKIDSLNCTVKISGLRELANLGEIGELFVIRLYDGSGKELAFANARGIKDTYDISFKLETPMDLEPEYELKVLVIVTNRFAPNYLYATDKYRAVATAR